MQGPQGWADYGFPMLHAHRISGPSLRDVTAYRAVVRSIGAQLAGLAPEFSSTDARRIFAEHLDAPEAAPVVRAAAGTPEVLIDRALVALGSFQPTAAGTAQCAADVVVILLLQQIDLAWWGSVPDFDDAEMVANSRDVVDLRTLTAPGRVRFNYSLASDDLTYRVRNYAVRKWFPTRRPGTPGPSSAFVRPQMIDLLNTLADALAGRTPAQVPALWVNSITRPMDQQRRLQQLGFTAHIPSAHCRGWAADIETEWFEHFGARTAIEQMLCEYRDAGIINAIDEGRIWHVCPNPDYLRGLAAAAGRPMVENR